MANEKRLIDADALRNQVMNEIRHYWNCGESGYYLAEDVIPDIDNAPTVDAVEVIHAHWEDGYAADRIGRKIYDSIDCSNCEEIFKIESHDREYWKKRFKVCPFCGAVMDEVDGNG